MPVIIQISKIQLRRGSQDDLQPETLDIAEMAFALDTGRLFIGPDPESPISGLVSRTLPPYDAVEVLTEASTQTFSRLHDANNRMIGPSTSERHPFFEATLPVSTWAPVMVKMFDVGSHTFSGETEEFTLADGRSTGGYIDYTISSLSGNKTLRSGRMTFVHDRSPNTGGEGSGGADSDVGRLVDESVAFPKISGNGTPILIDDLFVTGVEFRIVRVPDGDSFRVRLEYRNTEAVSYKIEFVTMSSSG